MINEESAYSILQLSDSATAEEIMRKYERLKGEYQRIKDETGDLKTHLEYQLKQIELDDVYIYFRRKQRI
jgi:DnaJ-class molecular chaperone